MSATAEPEMWSNEEIAEFLLNNSIDEQEYRRNLLEVLELGVDPLALNADHLFQEEQWSRPAAHPDLLKSRRSG